MRGCSLFVPGSDGGEGLFGQGPPLQELMQGVVTSVPIFAPLLLSNLMPLSRACAHWLLAEPRVGGFFFN